MEYKSMSISSVIMMTPKVFGDNRGFFMETFRQDDFEVNVGEYKFVQDNHSKSSKNILRGLHYQIKQPQGKLVRVIHGKVFDVAVDLRKSSPTFGQWVGKTLSSENKEMFWVPPGFAHGFCVLSDTAEFVYKCTDYYAPEHERCIIWNDPQIGIDWPLDGEPVLSDKDRSGMLLAEAEVFA